MGLRSCGSSDAVKRRWRACVSRLQLSAAALAKIISLMATSCGKQHSSACRQGGLQSPPLQQRTLAFPAVHLLLPRGTGMASQHLPGRISQSKEAFVAAWGSGGSCAAATSSLAELRGGETCLFSQLQPESTQPVEKGQGPARYSL